MFEFRQRSQRRPNFLVHDYSPNFDRHHGDVTVLGRTCRKRRAIVRTTFVVADIPGGGGDFGGDDICQDGSFSNDFGGGGDCGEAVMFAVGR